jgi:hypothetical protein
MRRTGTPGGERRDHRAGPDGAPSGCDSGRLAEPIRPDPGRDAGGLPAPAVLGAVDHGTRSPADQPARTDAGGGTAAPSPPRRPQRPGRRCPRDDHHRRRRLSHPGHRRSPRTARATRSGRPPLAVHRRGGGIAHATAPHASSSHTPDEPDAPVIDPRAAAVAPDEPDEPVIGPRAAAVAPAGRADYRLRGSPWQSLNFFPDPHGHGAFRPTLEKSASPVVPDVCVARPDASSLGAL